MTVAPPPAAVYPRITMSPQTTATFDAAASNAAAAGKRTAIASGAGKGATAPAASASETQQPATAEQAVKTMARAFSETNAVNSTCKTLTVPQTPAPGRFPEWPQKTAESLANSSGKQDELEVQWIYE
eukprot:6080754-Alexandrium_andersonii.AAC.1